MNNQTSNRRFYKKGLSNGLYMHIYEHIAVDRIVKHLSNHNQLSVLDYDIWANVLNRTFILEVTSYTEEAKLNFDQAFKIVDNQEITIEECRKAVQECSCEYERPFNVVIDRLLPSLNLLRKLEWESENDFVFDIEDKKISVQTTFEDTGIQYKRRTPRSFNEVIYEYEIPAEIFKGREQLMAPAMVLIEAVAVSHIGTNKYPYYSNGDQWDEGASRVAYQRYARFAKKQLPSIEELENITKTYASSLLGKDFIRKAQRLFAESYSNEPSRYFSDKTIHGTTGVIIGTQGWAKIATEENIKLLLANLSVKIIIEGNDEEVNFRPFTSSF